MLILKVIIWFLLLISHKMSFSYFREIVLEPVLHQLQYKSRYCLETYVNFEGNSIIFIPNLTLNGIFIFSRTSSGISSGTSSGTSSGISSGTSSGTSSGISSGNSSWTSSGTSSGTSYSTRPVTVSKVMLILKVIIWFLLLILHKISYHIFGNQFWNQLQYKPAYCSET